MIFLVSCARFQIKDHSLFTEEVGADEKLVG